MVYSFTMPSSRILACTLIVSLALCLPVNAQSKASNSATDFSGVRKLIQTEMAARKIPSISIAVARRGKILWEEAFGFADKENKIRANKETMYYTASVTKTFTATALAILAERKQVDLDRPINDYIRPLEVTSPIWDPKEATVRRVATHMAGLTTFGRNCWADLLKRQSDGTALCSGDRVTISITQTSVMEFSARLYVRFPARVTRISCATKSFFLSELLMRPLALDQVLRSMRQFVIARSMGAVRLRILRHPVPPAFTATRTASRCSGCFI
jgi:hypothetical protein